MPDQESTDSGHRDPSQESLTNVRASEDHPQTQHPNSDQEENATANLAKQIKREITLLEWIGIVTIFVNIVIASIYYGQLTQMRLATEAATKASNFSSDAFEINQGNFDRTMRQIIHQSAAQAESAAASTVAANAAGKQATASLGNLKVNQNMSRAWQRPYVWAKPIWRDINVQLSNGRQTRVPMLPLGDIGYAMDVEIEIRNSGTTPAINVRKSEPQVILDESEKARAKAQSFVAESGSADTGFVLAPNSPHIITMKGGSVLSKEKTFEEVVSSGRWRVYIVGSIEYQDVFKPATAPYRTTYCFQYWPNFALEFEPCPFGNSIE